MAVQNYGIGLNTDYGISLDNNYSYKFPLFNNASNTNFLESGDILDTPYSSPFSSKSSTSGGQDMSLQQLISLFSTLLKKLLSGNTEDLFSQDPSDIQDPPPAYSADGSPPPYQAPPSYAAATNNIQDPPPVNVGTENKVSPSSSTTTTQFAGDINVDGGGKNTITLKNTSDHDQYYAVFTNPGPGATSSFGVPNAFVKVAKGESVNFKLPDQSSGYVQQMNNYSEADYKAGKPPTSDNFKATRAEYTFNADGSLYFNDSNIDGYNAALKMTSNGQVAGSSESILAKVKQTNPELISVVGGQEVIEGSQFFSDQTNIAARNALDKYINHNNNPDDLNGNTTTYVMPNDDKAVRGTQSNSLTLEFGNA